MHRASYISMMGSPTRICRPLLLYFIDTGQGYQSGPCHTPTQSLAVVNQTSTIHSSLPLDFPPSSWMPDCEIDVERCDCVSRPAPTLQPRLHRCHLNSSLCAHRHQRLIKRPAGIALTRAKTIKLDAHVSL